MNDIFNADFTYSYGAIGLKDRSSTSFFARRIKHAWGVAEGRNKYYFYTGNQFGNVNLVVSRYDESTPDSDANWLPIEFPSGECEIDGGPDGNVILLPMARRPHLFTIEFHKIASKLIGISIKFIIVKE